MTLTKIEIQLNDDIEFLESKLYFKEIELLNSDDNNLFLRTFCHGIDAKRINFLKRYGFSISSIYPRNSSITKYNNFPMLEIFLKSKIKGINKN